MVAFKVFEMHGNIYNKFPEAVETDIYAFNVLWNAMFSRFCLSNFCFKNQQISICLPV